MLIILVGLTSRAVHQLNKDQAPVIYPAVTTVYQSLGLYSIEGKSWEDIKKAGYGTSVTANIFASGASAWFKNYLTPMVAKEYGINLKVNEIKSTSYAVNNVTYEVATNSPGTIDLVWINGANFKTMKSKKLLYGPWTDKVPSSSNFDWQSPDLAFDFGEPTKGLEMPFFQAQMVFVYDGARVHKQDLPQSMEELVRFVTDPYHALYRKFTYAAPAVMQNGNAIPGDFTGAAFLKMFLYAFGGGYENYSGLYDKTKLDAVTKNVLAKLKSLESGILRDPNNLSNPYYCTSQSDCNDLFKTGKIVFTMSYNPNIVGANAGSGWPVLANSYIPSEGSLTNLNFIAIPINAPNIHGALLVGNYIGSFAAQFSRSASKYRWIMPYSETSPGYADVEAGGWQTAFEWLSNNLKYNTTPPEAFFRKPYALPEPTADYASQLDAYWYMCLIDSPPTLPPNLC